MNVWAFNKPADLRQVQLLYEAVKNGKSRFGWSWKEKHTLKETKITNMTAYVHLYNLI